MPYDPRAISLALLGHHPSAQDDLQSLPVLGGAPQRPGFGDILSLFNLPMSNRVLDNRDAPIDPRMQGEIMLKMMREYSDPYKNHVTFPQSQRRATPLAADAGINDIFLKPQR